MQGYFTYLCTQPVKARCYFSCVASVRFLIGGALVASPVCFYPSQKKFSRSFGNTRKCIIFVV